MLVRASELPESEKSVHWLWEPYIPFGAVTILEGDPGLGKSFVALTVAAHASKFGSALYCAAEDCGATLRWRLAQARANLTNVFTTDEIFPLSSHEGIQQLCHAVYSVRPLVVVLDPLQAYHPRPDRVLMTHFTILARECPTAVVLIRHLRKSAGRSIIRGLGAIDIAAAARSVLLVAQDPTDRKGQRRLLLHTKSSLAPAGPTLCFTIEKGRLVWRGRSSVRPEHIK